ncbi:MAG: uroporphyrinogen-III C-methyltransferase [Alphaproteobacteria bacterium]|nr:uroporphyrinogen-III C-methyltransferase [Alphaproteobacteria bacterium]
MTIEPHFHDEPEVEEPRFATPPARVILVGAGPGDPELLTLKGLRAIQTADVILYDDLVDPAVLELALPRVRRIHVGKRGGRPGWKQRDIHELILAHAFGGRTIVRLKGGDPFVFGRGGEELAALRDAGLAVEVIPGITAAIAAAASTQVPLTHRLLSRTVTFLSGAGPGSGLPEFTHIDLEALNDGQHTIAVYMGVKSSGALGTTLIGAGWDARTPVLAIENVSRSAERRVRATIRDLAERPEALALKSPAIILVGRVAGLPVAGRLDVLDQAVTEIRERELAYA